MSLESDQPNPCHTHIQDQKLDQCNLENFEGDFHIVVRPWKNPSYASVDMYEKKSPRDAYI